MRALIGAWLAAGLALCCAACGHAGDRAASSTSPASASAAKTASATTQAPAQATGGRVLGDGQESDDDDEPGTPGDVNLGPNSDNDADKDNDLLYSRAYRDPDDREVVRWGSPASAADRSAASAVIRAYFAAAVAGDAARACSLTFTLFAEAIPEDYGQPPGPPALRGKTCAEVLTKLFGQEHSRLVGETASLHVTEVRVQGAQARAMLGFTTAPAAYLQLQRERGNWRVLGILGTALP